MADVKTFKKGIKLKPETADPNVATSNEGQVYFAKSGGARSQGLWFSDGTDWNQLLTSAGTDTLTKYVIPAATTTYTAMDNSEDVAICQPNAGVTLTITLPAASSSDSKLIKFVRKTSTGSVIIDGNSAETIDGQASVPFDAQYETLHLYCDGSEWFTLSSEVINVFDLTVSNPNVSTSLSNVAYYTADRPFLLTEASIGIFDLADNITGLLAMEIRKGANRGSLTTSVFVTNPAMTLTKEATTINVFSGANTHDGDYFLISNTTTDFYVWFYTSSSDPAPAGRTQIKVTYTGGETTAEMCALLKTALDSNGFSCSVSDPNVIAVCEKAGDNTDASQPVGQAAVNSITVSTPGSGAANSDSTNQVFNSTNSYIAEGEVLKIDLTSIPEGLSKYYIKVKGVR